MITKNIGYAYASSDMALANNHGRTGCWYLALYDEVFPMPLNSVVYTSSNKMDVDKIAEEYNLPYGKYSMHLLGVN